MSRRTRMRVLHVVPWYAPAWGAGGTAVATANLCKGLVENGCDVTVYTTDDAGGGRKLDVTLGVPYIVDGVTVFYFKAKFLGKYREATFSYQMAKKIRDNIKNFDIVHIGSMRHLHGAVVCHFAKKYGVPYFVTPHASLMKFWMNEIGSKLLKTLAMIFVDNRVIKRANAIHYLSEEERVQSTDYVKNDAYFVIGNGIDLDRFKRPRSYKIDQSDIMRLLFVGRIHPQKNIHVIVNAFAASRLLRDSCVLSIIGPIDDRRYYGHLEGTIEKEKLKRCIEVLPPSSPEEIIKHYWASHLLVMPSVVEGVSMSIIEALACSLPVLVSDRVGNFREIIEDECGVVFDPTVDSAKREIESLVVNRGRLLALSKNAGRAAEKRYDYRAVSRKMMEMYQSVRSQK